jgi:hypothetical protein
MPVYTRRDDHCIYVLDLYVNDDLFLRLVGNDISRYNYDICV